MILRSHSVQWTNFFIDICRNLSYQASPRASRIMSNTEGGEKRLQNEEYEKIVDNIKNIIEAKGMKQGVVATRAGFTPQDFSNMLNKRRKLIRIEHILRIADALGVCVNDLLDMPAGKG